MKRFSIILLALSLCNFFTFSVRLDVGKDKIVKVNNHVITLRELNKRYNEMSKMPSMDGKAPTKKSVLSSMIDEYLLREEVKGASNIVLDENQYQQMLNQYKMLYSQQMMKENPGFQYSEDAFKAYVEKEAMITYESFEERIKEQVLVRQYIMKKAEKKLQKVRDKNYSSKADFPIAIPDMKGGQASYNSLEDFYDRNVSEFVVPKSIELKHIFLSVVGPDLRPLPDSEMKIKEKKINDLHKRLVKGEDFDELCELNSEDIESRDAKNPKTGKIDRGYLGILPKTDEMTKKQFGEANFNFLFTLKKGQYSKVLSSKYGFHIFYVVDKNDQYIMPFNDAKKQIVDYFKLIESDRLVTEEFTEILKGLKSRASIVYYAEEYKE